MKHTGVYREKGRKIYWIYWSVNGRQYRESSHSDNEQVAYELRCKRIRDSQQGIVQPPSVTRILFDELAADVIRDYRNNGYHSLDTMKFRLDKHVLPFFGNRKALSIGVSEIEKYKDLRLTENASNSTINRELCLVRRAFTLAVENEKLFRVPRIKLLKEAAPREGYYEYPELMLVCRHLPETLCRLPLIAFMCGWRKQELLTLEWSRVDFESCIMSVPATHTKNNKPKIYPFSRGSRFEQLLLEQRAYTEYVQAKHSRIVPWVFHWTDGRQIRDFSDSWRKAHELAKVPLRLFHDLRRSCTRMISLGKAPRVYGKQITGHTSDRVFDQYAGGEIEALRDTTAMIEEQMDKMYKDRSEGSNENMSRMPKK